MNDFQKNSDVDLDALKAAYLAAIQENNFLKLQNANLKSDNEYHLEQLRLLNVIRFDKKADVASIHRGLFDEAEQEAPKASSAGDDDTIVVGTHTKKKPKRAALDARLPREELRYDLSEEEKICPQDGTRLAVIGEQVSEQLDIIPAKVFVRRHIRVKYGCPCCKEFIVTAKMPEQPLPKSNASPGVLAYVATAKYQDALPLYRQEKIFSRVGFDISRTTLASWMIGLGRIFSPLLNLMREDLVTSNYIGVDETPLQVLKRNGTVAHGKSYMWVFGRYGPEGNIVLFHYDATRSGKVPKTFLEGFQGYLQADGYDGYNSVTSVDGVIRLGCLAHVRRKFVECLKALGKEEAPHHAASEAVEFIGKLYKTESETKDLSIDERYAARQREAQPIFEEFKDWLDRKLGAIPPRSLFGKAIQYALNEWAEVTRYLERGDLRPDNNLIENAIRPFTLGRKNWLFSDTERGAEASAAIYSIIESAKANGHEPFLYLRHAIEKLPQAKTLEDLEKLLPYRLKSEIVG